MNTSFKTYFHKTLTLPLMLAILLLSCEGGERQTQLQPPEISPTEDTSLPEPDEVAVNVMAGADTTIQSNSIMNMLVPDLTVEKVLNKLPEAKITRKQPYPNVHVQGQVDTIVTIKSDSTIFQFYRLPDSDMLQTATLSKGGVKMGSGLEVGMTAEEVANLIPPLKNKKTIPQTILIKAEQTPTAFRLRFEKNRLSYIHYDGYVD